MLKASLFLGLTLTTALTCSADLEFESKSIELKANPSDQVVQAKFLFKNTGEKDVEVNEIQIGCSCLSATTDKKVYEPGESGRVVVAFRLGSFTGHQQKGLTIVTGDKRTRLQVGVQIPDVITITPDIAEWTVGEKPEAKSFKVVIDHPDPIKVLGVTCKREGFTHELKTVKEGREYEIVLKPASTAKAMLGMLTIDTDCEIPKHKTKMAFYAISRPKPSAKK
jgi:hypothetical protein